MIQALRDRDREMEAVLYEMVLPLQLSIKHGYTIDQLLEMDMDDIGTLLQMPIKPAKYDDWNMFMWGEAAFQ